MASWRSRLLIEYSLANWGRTQIHDELKSRRLFDSNDYFCHLRHHHSLPNPIKSAFVTSLLVSFVAKDELFESQRGFCFRIRLAITIAQADYTRSIGLSRTRSRAQRGTTKQEWPCAPRLSLQLKPGGPHTLSRLGPLLGSPTSSLWACQRRW